MASPKREVIYIDPEDDITSVIDKIKEGKSKVVAVVPGKRLGALQSAVNLRLLQRASQAVDKKLVIVSEDKSLIKMASGIGIYMSKNLQTRPAVPSVEGAPSLSTETEEIPEEDIASIKKTVAEAAPSVAEENKDIETEIEENADKMAEESAKAESSNSKLKKPKKNKNLKLKPPRLRPLKKPMISRLKIKKANSQTSISLEKE